MKLVVLSGKGGVGKSMVASSLAILFSKEKILAAIDCDVDAPNLGLWLGIKKMKKSRELSLSENARIIKEKCIECGKCKDACRYNAIEKIGNSFEVNSFLCEGCGTCKIVCPANAIELKKVKNAFLQKANSKFGFPVVSGQLLPGSSGSGKIVAELRKEAEKEKKELLILDSAAGIGCPVTASIVNTDFAVLVTEPTQSGLSDLKRVLKVVGYFNIPFGIIINQYDINPEFGKKIENFAGKNFLGKIPHDRKVVESIVHLRPVLESNGPAAREIKKIFAKIKQNRFA